MSFEINEPLDHIERSLGVQNRADEDFSLPSTVLDTIRAVIDAKGWQALGDFEARVTSTVGPVTDVNSDQPPEGEQWYVVGASLFHDQGTTHDLSIELFSEKDVIGVAIRESTSRGSAVILGLGRPVTLVRGMFLNGHSRTTVVGPAALTLRYMFIRLKKGEYLPGTPYG